MFVVLFRKIIISIYLFVLKIYCIYMHFTISAVYDYLKFSIFQNSSIYYCNNKVDMIECKCTI